MQHSIVRIIWIVVCRSDVIDGGEMIESTWSWVLEIDRSWWWRERERVIWRNGLWSLSLHHSRVSVECICPLSSSPISSLFYPLPSLFSSSLFTILLTVLAYWINKKRSRESLSQESNTNYLFLECKSMLSFDLLSLSLELIMMEREGVDQGDQYDKITV